MQSKQEPSYHGQVLQHRRFKNTFPDSNETQKGHMKKQRNGVRSTKLKETTQSEEDNIPGNTVVEVDPSPPKKMRDILIKIYNAVEMHSN